MSGVENTNTDPAQFSGINESSAVCGDAPVAAPESKEICGFDGVNNGSSSVFDSCVGNDGGYGGDITNWDLGKCYGEGLNTVQAVEEVLDFSDTGFQGGEQSGMGNNVGSDCAAQEPNHGNVCDGENMGCKPVEDGSEGMHCNEKMLGNSLDGMGTEGIVPHSDSCHDARNDCDKVLSCGNETTEGKSLSPREVENKTFEQSGVVSWESIYEVAKQSVEIVSDIPAADDEHMLSRESETGEPSAVLTGVQCAKSETVIPGDIFTSSVKSDIVSESLNPEGEAVHFQEEGLVEGVKFNESSKVKEDGIPLGVHDDQMQQKEDETSKVEPDNACKEETYMADQVGKPPGGIVEGTFTACDEKTSLNEQLEPSIHVVGKKGCVVVLGVPATDPTVKPHRSKTPIQVNEASEKSRRGRKPSIGSATSSKKTPQQTSASSSRALRSKMEKSPISPEPIANLENTQGSNVERRGRKKGEVKGKTTDQFSKMRKHLRYLLHRISYEQNLLDAYSSEGWRGQSLEKLRPEKELQRAKADINRSKVKIRELFHRLDSISTEGKFPESLYDDDGLIDSEDIFCAKCGSKELLAGNDIILCDGNCDRGFHQYCLEPPLRTEEIPPGDEGWFCPACDCKFDCIDLLNDSQGAKLSIEDSWEKVFPEAIAAMAGLKQDDIMGLPSDDSDDNDYNPDGQDDGSKDEVKESGSSGSDSDESDESDFSSASEDLAAVSKDDQYLGLPSDDSEDDDFNPDVPNANDDDDERASSSSDFTSASEDLRATGGNDDMSENGDSLPIEPDQNLDDSLPISGRRHIERLDYKKLYDEAYGNAVSDSSDDEEWNDDVGTTRSKSSAKREASASANGDALVSADGSSPAVTPRTRGRPKGDQEVENGLTVKSQKTPQATTSGGTSRKRPPYNKLPESITQRLHESFKENQYPDRSTKEKLAEELGITPVKVDKWFGNARWSFNHHPSRVEASIARVVPGGGSLKEVEGSSSKFTKENEETIATPRTTRKRGKHDEVQTDSTKENETKGKERVVPGGGTPKDVEGSSSKFTKENEETVATPRTTRKRGKHDEVQTDSTKENETKEKERVVPGGGTPKEVKGSSSKFTKENEETIATPRTTRKRGKHDEVQTDSTKENETKEKERVVPGGGTPKEVKGSSSKFTKENEATIATPRTTRKRGKHDEVQTDSTKENETKGKERVVPGGGTPKEVEGSSSKFTKENEAAITTPRTTRKRGKHDELQTDATNENETKEKEEAGGRALRKRRKSDAGRG
ncbi:uncharacterized protein LOC141599400 [Silene latifolia]|uniref:uncharacterized protein LOC141599400 n=1 Tax=Silene latifolia TaxID=37657 RepID=UPI003D789CA6